MNPEDKHKFIHDGKEFDRPPNLFDVGGGELKLLPEVLSDLNFETRDFKDDGTAAEQKELRDSRPWGRLYIDGWPGPIQYLRYVHRGPDYVSRLDSLVLDIFDLINRTTTRMRTRRIHEKMIMMTESSLNCLPASTAVELNTWD